MNFTDATMVADKVRPMMKLETRNLTNDTRSLAYFRTHQMSVVSPVSMFVCGVLGNILALVVIARTKRESRKTAFYILVATLAVVDIVGQISTSPVVIFVYLNYFRWPGDELCDYFSFAMVFSGLATLQIVCAMAVERYIALKHPFASQHFMLHNKSKYIILIIVIVSFTIGIMPVIGFGAAAQQYPGTWCFIRFLNTRTIHEKAYAYIFSSFGVIIILITIYCNISVAITMLNMCHKRRKNATIICDGDKRRNVCDHSELQMLLMLFGVICIFAVCWVPLMVRILISLIVAESDDNVSILIVIRLASLNQVLNPWVYILFRKQLLIRIKRFYRNVVCNESVAGRENDDSAKIYNKCQNREVTKINLKRSSNDEADNIDNHRQEIISLDPKREESSQEIKSRTYDQTENSQSQVSYWWCMLCRKPAIRRTKSTNVSFSYASTFDDTTAATCNYNSKREVTLVMKKDKLVMFKHKSKVVITV